MQLSSTVAEQPLDSAESYLSLAGQTCRLRTNSRALSDLLTTTSPAAGTASCCELSVIANHRDIRPRQAPRFRAVHHLAIATFGAANIFVFDLHRRRIAARITASLAEDEIFWRYTFLPIAAGCLGPAIGILPMHSACVSRGEDGLLVAGQSGTGKSTLSLALALRGMDYISDDWSYCSLYKNAVAAHATDAPLKLLPEAAEHFPALSSQTTHISMNGELAFEIEPSAVFNIQRRSWCYPRACFFYERAIGPTVFDRLDRKDLRDYLLKSVERLPPQLAQMQANRRHLIDRVAELPCWRFSSAGLPEQAAVELQSFFDEQLLPGDLA